MTPMSQDYSTESAGLFQANPGKTMFLYQPPPCNPACRWDYTDRTIKGTVCRVFVHTTDGDQRELVVPFNDLASRSGTVTQAAMAQLAQEHHEMLTHQWADPC